MNFQRLLTLPFIPILFSFFAYLELGGNYYGYSLLERGINWKTISGLVIFSIGYSLATAVVAYRAQFDMTLLMISYGFGFTLTSIFLKLEWGKLPEFTLDNVRIDPWLWWVAVGTTIFLLYTSWKVIVDSSTKI